MLRDRESGFTLVVGSACLFTIGLFIASLGPLLPELASRTGTSLAGIGSLITAIFVGAVPTQLITGTLNDRFGPKPLLIAGFLLVATGVFVLTTGASLPVLLLATAATGVGNGCAAVTVNVLIVRSMPGRALAGLNLANLFYGIGAILGPILVSTMVTTTGSGLSVFYAVVAVIVLQIGLVPFLKVPPIEPKQAGARTGGVSSLGLAIWLLVLVVVVYAGTENGIAAWATTMIERHTGNDRATATLVMSGFWCALTAGRFVVVLIGSRVSAARVLAACLVLATLGTALLLAGRESLPVSALAYAVIGFAFGPVFPATVAVAGQIAPRLAAVSTSIIIAGSSLGSMIIPFGQGATIEQFGATAGTGMVLVSCVVMLVLGGLTVRLQTASRTGVTTTTSG